MKKMILGQLKAALALAALMLIGIAVGGYILSNQRINPPSWVPIVGKEEFILRAQLTSVQGVLPGQGQAVTISGVRVGQIGSVELVDGAAVARLRIEKRYGDRIYPDATVLLRPKTPLKDMVAELDPGTPSAGPRLASGALLRTGQTAPDVNLEEVLSSLDRDSRDYLDLLVTDAGRAFARGGGDDLADVFRRFEPLSRNVAKASRLVARRRAHLERLVGNLSRVATELGARDRELVRFIRGSEGVFRRFAAQSARLEETVELLPPTLARSNAALAKLDTLGQTLAGAAVELRPAARSLAPTLRRVEPFFRRTTPVFEEQIRPFARAAQPTTRKLAPPTRRLAAATRSLQTLTGVLNAIVNELAYKSPGNRAEDNSFLFYVPWAGHNTNSVLSSQDGIGPLRRGVILVSCSSLQVLESLAAPTRNPTLATLIQLLGVPERERVCNSSGSRR